MRTRRQPSPIDLYHVIARGTGRQLIFEDDADRAKFLAICTKALRDNSAELYGWCLMSNHVHLLLHAPLGVVSAFMKQLCEAYAVYFNKKSGRTGHLFQERFRSEAICDERYLLAVLRYIHDNPAKAGLAKTEDYEWSSYSEYVHGPQICSTDQVLALLEGEQGFEELQRGAPSDFECMDVDGRNQKRAMPDDRARLLAADALDGIAPEGIKALPVNERNAALSRLRELGFTIRQTERLTGIGRSTVSRVWMRADAQGAMNS